MQIMCPHDQSLQIHIQFVSSLTIEFFPCIFLWWNCVITSESWELANLKPARWNANSRFPYHTSGMIWVCVWYWLLSPVPFCMCEVCVMDVHYTYLTCCLYAASSQLELQLIELVCCVLLCVSVLLQSACNQKWRGSEICHWILLHI
jgi:hypothetical protein